MLPLSDNKKGSAGADRELGLECILEITSVAAAEASPAWQTSKSASSMHAEKKGAWGGLLRFFSGSYALALADQTVVSGTSFLTTVLIARVTDPGQLGIFAIGISVLASVHAVQDSLILLPYSIRCHHPSGTRAEYAGASLTLSGVLSALTAVALILSALAMSAWSAGPEMVAMTWALAGVVPFWLAREFGRRFAFAHL